MNTTAALLCLVAAADPSTGISYDRPLTGELLRLTVQRRGILHLDVRIGDETRSVMVASRGDDPLKLKLDGRESTVGKIADAVAGGVVTKVTVMPQKMYYGVSVSANFLSEKRE